MSVYSIPIVTTSGSEEGWHEVSAELTLGSNDFRYHAKGLYFAEDDLIGVFKEAPSETTWVLKVNPPTDDVDFNLGVWGYWQLSHNGKQVASSYEEREVRRIYDIVCQRIWGDWPS